MIIRHSFSSPTCYESDVLGVNSLSDTQAVVYKEPIDFSLRCQGLFSFSITVQMTVQCSGR